MDPVSGLAPKITLAVLIATVAACRGPEPTQESNAPNDIQPAEEWVALGSWSSDETNRAPRPLTHSRDSLRVITELREAAAPVSTGVVVTNILNRSMIPVGSVYAEQRLPTEAHVDTTVLAVPREPLLLHIAVHRGLRRWRVTVEERVAP
jgi:hypothetical protein